MTANNSLGHAIGRRKAADRQQPRKSKRDNAVHSDRYASQREDPEARRIADMLLALAAHYNGEEGNRV